MNKDLHSEFKSYCENSMSCEVCALYFLSEELKVSCEEIFECLSEKFQIGIAEENQNE